MHPNPWLQGNDISKWLASPSIVPKACIIVFAIITMAMAAAWIQMVAGELVNCLRACGILLGCPPALLGFTLAAINSMGDLATNTAVAQVSGKRAAFAACFCGQTFNLAMASVYGFVLNVMRTHQDSIEMQISPGTWILWLSLMGYLLVLLFSIAGNVLHTGAVELPYQCGRAARYMFAVLLGAFLVRGAFAWSSPRQAL